MAVPWLIRSFSDLSPRGPGFDPESVLVGFVAGEVTVGQGFLRLLVVFPVLIIPSMLRAHSFICY
jgi:hypothetical protein